MILLMIVLIVIAMVYDSWEMYQAYRKRDLLKVVYYGIFMLLIVIGIT